MSLISANVIIPILRFCSVAHKIAFNVSKKISRSANLRRPTVNY